MLLLYMTATGKGKTGIKRAGSFVFLERKWVDRRAAD